MPSKSAHNKSGWRDVQTKTKTKKRSKLAIWVLAILAGLFLISSAVRFTERLFSSWNLPTTPPKKYSWNGEFNLNLVIRTPHYSLFSYNPTDKKIVIINIPDETFLDVPAGFGKWQLSAIYELGQSQKGIGGYKLLNDTLTSFLALPIDGFLDLSILQNQQSAFKVVETLRKNPFLDLNFWSTLKTDLTIMELVRLKLGVGSVRFDKIKELNLDALNILDRENLLDGTAVFTADPVRLDSVLSDLVDSQILGEHKSIAVFNATDYPQLAGRGSRLITNLGGDVIITASAKQRLKKTQVVGEQSLTLTRLKQIFELDCQSNPECDRINPSSEDIIYQRAQINVLLGEDYIDQ